VALHEWAFATRPFRSAHGMEWSTNVGATIMGRNMFGPVRGSWGDEAWTGWSAAAHYTYAATRPNHS
jgi:hypothetical protein